MALPTSRLATVLVCSSGPSTCAARARELGLQAVAVVTGKAAANEVLVASCGGSFSVAVVERLSLLGPRPIDALKLAAKIGSLGIRVEAVDPGEQWISSALPALTDALDWLDHETKRWRASVIRESALKNNRRPGRPRRAIPGAALALVERMPLERAARELGVGASTLRRWLQARTEEQKLASLAQPPGRVA